MPVPTSTRRTVLSIGTMLAVGMALAPFGTHAQTADASPAASATSSLRDLDQRVLAISPYVLHDTLQFAPVTTDLFPIAAGSLVSEPWNPSDNEAMQGIVGGILIHREETKRDAVGFIIVAADAQRAREHLEVVIPNSVPREELSLLGFTGRTFISGPGEVFAATALLIGNLVLAGGAEGQDDMTDLHRLVLRSTSYAVALIDHVDRVISER